MLGAILKSQITPGAPSQDGEDGDMVDRAYWQQGVEYPWSVWVEDSSGAAVTGLVQANFSIWLVANGVVSAVPVTLTETDSVNLPGNYTVKFTPNARGTWECRVKHATYFVAGTKFARAFLQVGGGPVDRLIRTGTAQAGAAQSITLDAGASAVNQFYRRQLLVLTGGTGAGQGVEISNYDGATKVCSIVENWAVQPDNTTTFSIFSMGVVENDTIFMQGTAAPVPSSGFMPSDVQKWNGSVPNGLSAGRVDAVCNAMGAGVINGATIVAGTIEHLVWESLVASYGNTAGSFGERVKSIAVRTGTAQAGGANSITLDAGASATDLLYRYQFVSIMSGAGAGQTRWITTYTGSTKVATVAENWQTNPDNTSVFVVLPFAVFGIQPSLNLSVTQANVTQWLASAVNALVGGDVPSNVKQWTGAAISAPDIFGYIKTNAYRWLDVQPAALDGSGFVKVNLQSWLGSVPNALVAGRVDALLGAVTAGAITAAAFAAGALGAVWDELTSGHGVSGSFGQGVGATALRTGTAQAGTATTITLDAGASAVDNLYVDDLVVIVAGTGAGQVGRISQYAGATKIATIFGTAASSNAWLVTPNNTSVFVILTSAPADVQGWRGAIPNGISTANNVQVSVKDWLGSVPNALVAGRVDARVGAILAGAIDAASIAAGAAQFLADQLLDRAAAIDTFSPRQWFRVVGAFIAGTTDAAVPGPANMNFKAMDGSKTRATTTADANGNRTVDTIDAS